MKKLPEKQVIALERAYRSAKGRREAGRYQALWLLAKGYSRKQVRDVIGVSKSRLGDWVTSYYKGGLEELQTKPQPGNHRYLTNVQKTELKELITTKTPQETGYEGRFWDIGKLRQLVKDKFKVEYKSDTSYRKLFKWCGLSCHKPDRVNNRQSVKSKKEFEEKLKKDWRGIARQMGWYW